MEKEQGITGGSSRLLSIAPRISTIVLAVILIIVAAGTIGIIDNNTNFDLLRETDRAELTDVGKELQDLVNESLGAAGWLIVLGIGVLIAEIVSTILTIADIQALTLAAQIASVETLKLVARIIDIIFSIAVAVCYGATGIACAVFAGEWGKPPEPCEGTYYYYGCDDKPLTATNALSTVFCFIQTALFGFIAFWVIYTLVKSRKA